MEEALTRYEDDKQKLLTALRERREAATRLAQLNSKECRIHNEQNKLLARRNQLDGDIIELQERLRG